MPTINVERYEFHEDFPDSLFLKAGIHIMVWYEVWEDDGSFRTYLLQKGSRHGPFEDEGKPVWHWDGNREAPTLTDNGKYGKPSYKAMDRGLEVHFTFRGGQICGIEAPVRVAPRPSNAVG